MIAKPLILTLLAAISLTRFFSPEHGLTRLCVTWLAIASVTYTLLILYNIFIYPIYSSPLRNLPAAPQGPVLGRLLKEPNSPEVFDTWRRTIPNQGLIRFNGLLNRERVLVTSPDAIKEVLKKRNDEFNRTKFTRGIIASLSGPTSLFVVHGEAHKLARKRIYPFFQANRMNDLYPIFVQVADSLRNALVANNEGPKELCSMLQHATLDAIGLAGFGQSYGAVENPKNEFVTRYESAFHPQTWGLRTLLLAFFEVPVVNKLLAFNHRDKDILAAMDFVKDHGRDLIQSRQDVEKGNGILDVSIRSNVFNDQELLDMYTTFLLAGHDTSSKTLAWSIFHLSQDLPLQSRMRQEIRAKISTSDQICDKTLSELALVNGVINESLRLYPIVPIVRRAVTAPEGTVIQGLHFPRDTNLFIPTWSVNRDKARWGPDAEDFRPERWIKDPLHGGASDVWDMMAFSHGSRSCVGERFARNELMAFFAVLFGNLEFEFKGTGTDLKHLERDPAKVASELAVVWEISHGLWVDVRSVPGWES